MIFKVSVRVDLGVDLGQNFGSLFEASDGQGIAPKDISWGKGVYGGFRGEIVQKTIQGEGR